MAPGSKVTFNSKFLGRTDDDFPLDPAPPYQLEYEDGLLAQAEFDPIAVRAALPPELEPLDDHSGVIIIASVPRGWGLAPYTQLVIGLFVKGHDSPDGSPAIYEVASYFSGKAGVIMPRDYNARAKIGYSRQWQVGDVYWAEAGPPDEAVVRFAMHCPTREEDSLFLSGIFHWMGEARTGGQNVYTVAFSGRDYSASVASYEVLPGAPDLIKSLVPVKWTSGVRTPHTAITFGPPRPLEQSMAELAADATRISLMDILSRIGHATALVTPDGRVLFINTQAREMLAGALHNGRLMAWRRQDQTQLGTALGSLQPGRMSPPVALRRPGGALPILARALPVNAALAGEPAALLLFSDPTAPAPSTELTLTLLGLTPAEARIAAQIGRGLTSREAAQIVGVTESTARSTLKSVYGKLDIGKQSELALIVARLEGFG